MHPLLKALLLVSKRFGLCEQRHIGIVKTLMGVICDADLSSSLKREFFARTGSVERLKSGIHLVVQKIAEDENGRHGASARATTHAPIFCLSSHTAPVLQISVKSSMRKSTLRAQLPRMQRENRSRRARP